ncbi:MAG: nucleotide exchange factor GrpE [Acidaminococcaceae bacterium]|nr:nucleotide exchange factor GrpE [Acidaminococcaceae bacterium]MDD4721450.1 nucleotide exchange factor GrpE [Acidaminococcaceae bacterium]
MQNKEHDDVKKEISTEELVAEEAVTPDDTAKSQEETSAEAPPQVDERDVKIEDLQNKLLRLQADFDNSRRRNNEEQTQLAGFVTVSVVNKFLKVLDNFERAEASIEKSPDSETIRIGLEKIHKQFEQALKELNVVEIPSQGEKFNPEFHEAIMRTENSELPEDTIDMVLEKGYKINERIVRHSKVRVVTKA